MAVDVSILIVSFNTSEMTRTCLRSVFEQTHEATFEVLVLDNASSDGSADAIELEFGKRVRLIRSERNLGFAAGNNEAARSARGKRLLLLNPDTVILDGAIDHLIRFANRRPTSGVWGGRTFFADGSLNPSSCWRQMSLWSLAAQAMGVSQLFSNSAILNPEAYGGWARDSERQVDIVSGCFLLIDTHLWRELHGFDLRFFMYGEEADLCLRLRTRGYKPRVTPSATIIHHGGASERVRADKLVRLLAAKTSLLEIHWPPTRAALGRTLLAAWPLSRLVAFSIICFFRNSHQPREIWREVWLRRREWWGGYAATQRNGSSPL